MDFSQLITARNTVASIFGECETTKAVSREVLRRTRYEWWAKFLSYCVFGSWSDYVREGEGYTDVHFDY